MALGPVQQTLASHPALAGRAARVAVIGSRRLSDDDRALVRRTARELVRSGHVLYSGGADGADTLFASAALAAGGQVVCVIPWRSYRPGAPEGATRILYQPEIHTRWTELAEAAHPVWGRLSRGTKALHARNSGILLAGADEPVDCVITMRAADRRGGTEQGLRIAALLEIPVIDLRAIRDA